MNLYEINMKVRLGPNSGAPAGMSAAVVACYSSARDYEHAVREGVRIGASKDIMFEDIVGPVREIP